MTDTTVAPAEILSRFTAWMLTKGFSQSAAAKLLACSPATLSQVLSNSYAGDTARMLDKINRLLSRDVRRENAPKPMPFQPTSVTVDVVTACRRAHDRGQMAVICGESGIGKTVALDAYRRAEPDTLLITIRPCGHNREIRSSRPTLMAIAAKLDIEVRSNMANSALIETIGAKLAESDRLLIIDEIDYTGEILLQALRNLHDLSKTGIVYVSTGAWLGRLRAKQSATIDQFLNRIAFSVMLRKLNDDDVDKLCSHLSLSRAAMACAREHAHGVARRLDYALKNAQDLAQIAGRPIDEKIIASAYAELMEICR